MFIGHLYGTPKPEEDVREYDKFKDYSNENSLLTTSLTITKFENSHLQQPKKQQEINSNTIMVQTDLRGPLPPNWEVAYSENGEKYFIE